MNCICNVKSIVGKGNIDISHFWKFKGGNLIICDYELLIFKKRIKGERRLKKKKILSYVQLLGKDNRVQKIYFKSIIS